MTDGSREELAVVLEALVENLPDGVLVEDASREILVANGTLCDLLDVPHEPAELVGRDCRRAAEQVADRFDADEEAFLARIETLLDEREPVHGEEVELEDGRILERTYVPYSLPDGRANIWIYRDVTERATNAAELERQNERLEEFASVVSHDLRNPISVASTSLELAREECESDHLDEVARSLDRMDRLTSQLLTLARRGERTESLEPTPLSTLVEQSWQNVETRGADLVNETSGIVAADWSRLGQLFENLFHNAVEHGGDDVEVRVETTDDGFRIADDGAGLDPDADPDRLFETGYSTKPGGTGLGLGIVDEIATAHGWEVTAKERADGGLRFEISGVEYEG